MGTSDVQLSWSHLQIQQEAIIIHVIGSGMTSVRSLMHKRTKYDMPDVTGNDEEVVPSA